MTAPDDDLLARYREANALENAAPKPALRAAVLAQARALADQRAAAAVGDAAAPEKVADNQTPASPQAGFPPPLSPRARNAEAANDRRWLIASAASVAVLAVVGLLALQFDHGNNRPQPQQDLALQRPIAPAPATAAAPAPLPETAPPPEIVAQNDDRIAPPRAAAREKSAQATESRVQNRTRFAEAKRRDEAQEIPSSRAAAAPAPFPATAPPPPTVAQGSADLGERPLPVAKSRAPNRAEPAGAQQAVAATQAPLSGGVADVAAAAPSREQFAAAAPAQAAPPPALARAARAAPALSQRLLAAAAAGQTEAARQALASGAPPDAADATGRTALMLAAGRGNADLVRLLLAAGADPRRADHNGQTAASHARRAGHQALAHQIEAAVKAGSPQR